MENALYGEIGYLAMLEDVLKNGHQTGDRTGTGTRSLFGYQLRFDLQGEGFPLLTTKKIFTKGIIHELLWLISGSTNIKYLQENGVRIWDEWSQFDNSYPRENEIYGEVAVREGVGADYDGDFSTRGLDAKRGSVEDKLRGVWIKMMSRCYKKDAHNYRFYGEVGVRVSKEWHDCKKFVEDVKKIDGWKSKLSNWKEFELDKDYFGANVYSKDTCVWISKRENNLYTSSSKPFIMTVDDVDYTCFSLSQAEILSGVPRSTIHNWLHEGKSELSDYRYRDRVISFKEIKVRKGYVYRILMTNGELGNVYGRQWRNWISRYTPAIEGRVSDAVACTYGTVELDQLQSVIDRIRTNPTCRRLLVSAWNAGEIHSMALPPCHTMFQFKVYGDTLHLQLYQRSADIFLGVPFNIASYSLLLMMVAKVTGLKVGEFIHTFGDVHLYNNHVEQAKEQLSRSAFVPPRVIIHGEQKEIDDFEYDDFEIIDYECHPTIKAEVSV